MYEATCTNGDAASLGSVAAGQYVPTHYKGYSGAKSYTFASQPGRLARLSCVGNTQVVKPNPGADISPDNLATITPAGLELSDGVRAYGLNADLYSLPNGVSDEYDGIKLTRRVGRIVLDGTESWIASGYNTNVSYQSNNFYCADLKGIFDVTDLDAKPVCTCSHFIPASQNEIKGRGMYAITAFKDTPGELRLSAPKAGALFSTPDELKTWLKSNPVTVLYELSEPVATYASLDIPLSTVNTITSTDAVLPYVTLREIAGPSLAIPHAIDAQMLGGHPGSWYERARENLLINGNFMINQQGKTEYTHTSTSYGLDGWKVITVGLPVTATVKSGYVTYACAGKNSVNQYLENPNEYRGKVVTAALRYRTTAEGILLCLWPGNVNGNIQIGGVPLPVGEDWQTVTLTAVVPDQELTYLRYLFQNPTGSSIDVSEAKLEYGDHFTGWNSPDPALELMRCRRYYQKCTVSPMAALVDNSQFNIGLLDYTPMRTDHPAVKLLTTLYAHKAGETAPVNLSAVTGFEALPGMFLHAYLPANTFTSGGLYSFNASPVANNFMTARASVALDARL